MTWEQFKAGEKTGQLEQLFARYLKDYGIKAEAFGEAVFDFATSAEREACAKIVEEPETHNEHERLLVRNIVIAIRGRSDD